MAAPTPVSNPVQPSLASPRGTYKPFSVDVTVLAANDGTPTLAALKAGFTIFVTKIIVSVTTDNAATLTFQDSADTPVLIAKTKASPGLGAPMVWEFGEDGTALTEGKNFNMAISAAGLAARVHVEGYWKQTSPVVPSGV
jgi:hypothetical protein